jgi:hypothetical protein
MCPLQNKLVVATGGVAMISTKADRIIGGHAMDDVASGLVAKSARCIRRARRKTTPISIDRSTENFSSRTFMASTLHSVKTGRRRQEETSGKSRFTFQRPTMEIGYFAS